MQRGPARKDIPFTLTLVTLNESNIKGTVRRGWGKKVLLLYKAYVLISLYASTMFIRNRSLTTKKIFLKQSTENGIVE